MKRAALYIRVSTEEQARHGLSLPEQKADLERYASEHDFSIAGIYEDAGISARKPYKKRPALLRLLDDCQAGKIDTILFIKLDRWFRNVGNYYAVQEILDQCNVSWQATKEDYETATASGRLKVNIMLSVAQDEADRTSERIKFVFEGKRERREPLTGNTPTGYKIVGKKFVKDPNMEPIVSSFFKKYLQCGSISETQEFLREKYNYKMGYYIVDKLLSSTAYYGYYYDQDGMCPPYITKEEYDKIQTMRRRVVRGTKSKRIYMFSGILFCGECGYRLGGRLNKTSRYPFYNCAEHYLNRVCPNNCSISEHKIELYLLDTLDETIKKYKEIEIENQRSIKSGKDYGLEISQLKNKVKKLKNLYLDDFITIEEYKHDRKELEEKIADLEAKQGNARHKNFEKIDAIIIPGWRDAYDSLDRASQRDFLRILIREIRFYKDRHIEYELNI